MPNSCSPGSYMTILFFCVFSGSWCAPSIRQWPCGHDLHWSVLAAYPGRRPEPCEQAGLSGGSQSTAARRRQVSSHTATTAGSSPFPFASPPCSSIFNVTRKFYSVNASFSCLRFSPSSVFTPCRREARMTSASSTAPPASATCWTTGQGWTSRKPSSTLGEVW